MGLGKGTAKELTQQARGRAKKAARLEKAQGKGRKGTACPEKGKTQTALGKAQGSGRIQEPEEKGKAQTALGKIQGSGSLRKLGEKGKAQGSGSLRKLEDRGKTKAIQERAAKAAQAVQGKAGRTQAAQGRPKEGRNIPRTGCHGPFQMNKLYITS